MSQYLGLWMLLRRCMLPVALVIAALATASDTLAQKGSAAPRPPRGGKSDTSDEGGLTLGAKLIDLDGKLREASFQGVLPENRFERPEPTARSFDWTKLRPRMTVHDQGRHGTCWAHAAIGAMEWNWTIRNGKPVTLSAQPIIDRLQHADGGRPASVYQDLCLHGTCELSEYAYTGTPGRLKNRIEMKYRGIGFGMTPDTQIDCDRIKRLLVSHGPVSTGIEATAAFSRARGGVFREPEAHGQQNHAVLIVGWDDDRKAWKIQNSWGKQWGENGYQWVSYDTNGIGVRPAWIMAQAVHYQLPDDAHKNLRLPLPGQPGRSAEADPFPAWPQAKKIGSANILTPAELLKQEAGARYRVEFVVKHAVLSRMGGPLHLASAGRGEARIVIRIQQPKMLKARGIDDPEKYFPGKNIRVAGPVNDDGEDGEMTMLVKPADLEVIE